MDWVSLALAVLALAASLVLLWHSRRIGGRLVRAARLVPEWEAMADRYAGSDQVAAEELRFCAYWLRVALSQSGTSATVDRG